MKTFTKTDSLCLKGIAIIIMMFHHCYRKVEQFENYVVDFRPFSQEFVVDISDYFKICVSIFAFITGYGLYLSAKNSCTDGMETGKWVCNRWKKTLGGFWFVYVLSFVITQIFAGYPAEVYCQTDLLHGIVYAVIDFLGLAHLLSTPTMVPTWWYMSAAIVFVAAVPVFLKWTQKLGYATLFIFIMCVPRLVGDGYPGGRTIPPFLPALILGMLFAQYDLFGKLQTLKILKNKKADAILWFVIYAAAVYVSILVFIRVSRQNIWEFHFGVCPLIVICFCVRYVNRIPIVRDILAFLGKHSMNIFLIHTFFRYIFFGEFIYGFRYFGLIAFVLLIISLGISIAVEGLKKLLVRWKNLW